MIAPEAAKDNTLTQLTARWAPLVDTLLALVTASAEAKDFGSRLSDENYVPTLAKQTNALLHAMGSAEKHKNFAELITLS